MRIENLEIIWGINRQKLKKNADACRIWPLPVIIPINQYTQKLAMFPLAGKPVEMLEGYYDLFIPFAAGGYTLRYRVYKQTIYVIFIKHSKELTS